MWGIFEWLLRFMASIFSPILSFFSANPEPKAMTPKKKGLPPLTEKELEEMGCSEKSYWGPNWKPLSPSSSSSSPSPSPSSSSSSSSFDSRSPSLQIQVTSDLHLEFLGLDDKEWGKELLHLYLSLLFPGLNTKERKEEEKGEEENENESEEEKKKRERERKKEREREEEEDERNWDRVYQIPIVKRAEIAIQFVSQLKEIPVEASNTFEEMISTKKGIANLALLGDIGLPLHSTQLLFYVLLLRWCSLKFSRVLILCGNHEFYDKRGKKTTNDCFRVIDLICQSFPGLVFLNRSRVDIDGVVVLGVILWTNPPPQVQRRVEMAFSDYRNIFVEREPKEDQKVGGKEEEKEEEEEEKREEEAGGTQEERIPGPLRIEDTIQFHDLDIKFIESQLLEIQQQEEQKENKTPVMVLTHHAPSPSCCSKTEFSRFIAHGCATDLRDMFKDPLKVWVCGHTHVSRDEVQGQTRLVSNARGYQQELNPNYQNDFYLEV